MLSILRITRINLCLSLSLQLHDDYVTGILFHCAQNLIVTASRDCTVKVWKCACPDQPLQSMQQVGNLFICIRVFCSRILRTSENTCDINLHKVLKSVHMPAAVRLGLCPYACGCS